MTDSLYNSTYNPDVLSCLANLSNDEVFTPPEIANAMLDLLPQKIFESTEATFLDPACKSGVFLREIAKRLLNAQIPDYEEKAKKINSKKAEKKELTAEEKEFEVLLQKKIDHIFKKQLFGIAITELTSLLSRRSVYCSKYPNSRYSVTQFDDIQGNIRFKNISHTWKNERCIYCGATKKELDRGKEFESHAYEFIHRVKPEEILKMKFDVIIGNPPYQLNLGNKEGNKSKAKSIYHIFISKSKELKPKYLVMITPSRWMTKTQEGIPDSWVDEMLTCNKIKVLHDYEDSLTCFPSVKPIRGGVSYFLYDRDYEGKCDYYYHSVNGDVMYSNKFLNFKNSGIAIRDSRSLSILDNVMRKEGDYISTDILNFSSYVSPKDFFTNKELLTSSWSGFSNIPQNDKNIKYYLNKSIHKKDFGWISVNQIPKNKSSITINKIYIPAAAGSGNDSYILGKPFLGESNSVCSQTFLVIGYDPEKHNFSIEVCNNIISYISTKFFRYLVSIKKKTQNGPRGVYQFVPLQDFSKPWTDEELYKKYNLSGEEIAFIESMIKPMDLNTVDLTSEDE